MTDVADTIGRRLRAARESKGVSIEDAAFETRIHASYLRGLENDDYSAFASSTYAKSFLTLYSRYLGVDASEALHYFEGSEGIRLAGAAVLPTLSSAVSISPREAKRAARPVRVQTESPGFAPVLLGLLVLGLVAGIPLLWFLGKDADSLDEVTTKAKALTAARQENALTTAANTAAAAVSDPASAAPPPPAPMAASAPAPAPGPAAPAASSTERPGRRSVAADWVLGGAPESPASAKPAPAASSPSPATTLAAVAPASATSGLANLAPAPLRAVPASSGSSGPDSGPSGSGAASPSRPGTAGQAAAIQASPIETGSLPDRSETVPSTPLATPVTPTESNPAPGQASGADAPPPVIRATPLIAVPVAIPSEAGAGEGDPSETGTESETGASSGGEDADRNRSAGRMSGVESTDSGDRKETSLVDRKNRFPRALNP